jgi:hypothetical protein
MAWQATMYDAFGTTSGDFIDCEMSRIANSQYSGGQIEAPAKEMNAALAVIDGTRPANEIEAMLASQMVVTHELAMAMIGKARRAETIEKVSVYGSLATKLSRTFAMQIEAHAKLKRGGEQTVRVEHVHVHQGGQAIVGNVNAPVEGAGSREKVGGQPHAVGYAPGIEMPRQVETERATVPRAGGTGV